MDAIKNKKRIDNLAPCMLVRFSKKTGKVDICMDALGHALLDLWGLQNTTKAKATFVFEKSSGMILAKYLGTADGFPECEFPTDPTDNIEDYCPGFLSVMRESEGEQ